MVGALALAAAVWALVTVPPRPLDLGPTAARARGPVVKGAYHVHSVRSDGTGTVEEIAAAAARAGLAFVLITDHGDATREPAEPAYHDGVLCLDGVEISTDEGHYVALGLPQAPYPLGGEARDVIEDVARLGGFGIAAHPDSAKVDLSWREWNAPVQGIEWFNADSQWRDEHRWRLLPAILHYAIRPGGTVAALFDRPEPALAHWDRLNRQRPVVGLAAHDAHQRVGLRDGPDPYRTRWYLRLPGYEAQFRAFAIRAVLDRPFAGDAARDARQLVDAITAGRVYTAMDAFAAPASFSFEARAGNRRLRMGESAPLTGPLSVEVRSNAPADAATVLLRDGRPVAEAPGGSLTWTGALPGAYRTEVRLAGAPGHPPVPWIVSNPIYAGLAPRAAPAGPPPAVALRMWPALAWMIEKDAGSRATLTRSGPADAPAITLEYELGTALGTAPYVAAATREIGPLRDATRVGFHAVADRPMRVSFQVRLDANESDLRWRRSFFVDSTPREYLIVFDDLRPVRTAVPPRVDPARVDTMLFVVDGPHTAPGSRGRLQIERIRTER